LEATSVKLIAWLALGVSIYAALVATIVGAWTVYGIWRDRSSIKKVPQRMARVLFEGESIGALLGQGPPTPALAHLRTDEQGFTWIPQDDFVNHFAADVDQVQANVMYAVQQPAHVSVVGEPMGTPAWKTLPTWYLVAKNDEAIPPEAQRLFAQRMGATTVEIKSSHVPMVSHPEAATDLIVKAAQAVTSGD
jgi:pimeloyl-ACP methyl ester carboxylesterase